MNGESEPQAPEVLKYNLEIKNPQRVFKVVAFLFVAVVMVRNTWLVDDAFITMRVVDNFLNGFGLVWNVGERVQAFTSPLWLFLLVVGYAVIRDAYFTMYLLSLVISLASFLLILQFFCKNYWMTLLVTLLVVGSTAFIDYSSSGLENPLTHFLLIVTLVVVFRLALSPLRMLLVVSLLACLAALTRLDSLLFYIPFLLYALYKQWRDYRAYLVVVLAFLPLLAWSAGATYYFGFPFPNTFYAKLPTNYPLMFFIEHGIGYYLNSLHWDPLTLLTILTGMVLVVWNREPLKIAFVAGVGLYLLYGLRIGGDFMSGRFVSAAFIVMVVLLTLLDYEKLFGVMDRRFYWLAVVVVIALGISADAPPVFLPGDANGIFVDNGVENSKLFYFPDTGMLSRFKGPIPPKWGREGVDAKRANQSPVVRQGIGLFGYYAGPGIYIIDVDALTDPMRARMPAPNGSRVGHFKRLVPEGYEATVSGDFTNRLIDPRLRAYYDKMFVLTHGSLSAPDRLSQIIAFNLGNDDTPLKEYALDFK